MPSKRQSLANKKGKAPTTSKDNSMPHSPPPNESQVGHDEDSEADELTIMAQQLITAVSIPPVLAQIASSPKRLPAELTNLSHQSKKRRQARRQGQVQDIEEATQALSIEINQAYEEQINLKKEKAKEKLQELKILLERQTQIEEAILVRVDQIERATLAMNREMTAAVMGKRADLKGIVSKAEKGEGEGAKKDDHEE